MKGRHSTDIQIYNETDLSIPLSQNLAIKIVNAVSEGENIKFAYLEVVYVDEEAITDINNKHLGHNYVTDIITFGYNKPDDKSPVEATIFCCAPRIIEQAGELKVSVDSEFFRVFIHGLLHLTGYGDYNDDEKTIMREGENKYLNYIQETYAK